MDMLTDGGTLLSPESKLGPRKLIRFRASLLSHYLLSSRRRVLPVEHMLCYVASFRTFLVAMSTVWTACSL